MGKTRTLTRGSRRFSKCPSQRRARRRTAGDAHPPDERPASGDIPRGARARGLARASSAGGTARPSSRASRPCAGGRSDGVNGTSLFLARPLREPPLAGMACAADPVRARGLARVPSRPHFLRGPPRGSLRPLGRGRRLGVRLQCRHGHARNPGGSSGAVETTSRFVESGGPGGFRRVQDDAAGASFFLSRRAAAAASAATRGSRDGSMRAARPSPCNPP